MNQAWGNQRDVGAPKDISTGGCHILIVDDYENVRDVVSRMLSDSGFQVQTAKNGTEALRLFSGAPFGLVLTDFNMPGMDGLTLAEEIRKLSPATPVILMTGADLAGSKEKECVVSILQKPFRWQDLEEAILAAMRVNPLPFAWERKATQQ